MSISIGYDEGYKCTSCNKIFSEDEAMESHWKCPVCGEYMMIAAPKFGTGHVKNRKKASELENNDLVVIPGYSEIYELLDIFRGKNNVLNLILRRYGTLECGDNDYVDIIVGRYNKDNW